MRSGDSMSENVVITGIGPVSSIGIGAAAFEESLFAGRVGTSTIASFDSTGFKTHQAGEVHDFRAADICRNIDVNAYGRSSQFAAAAARLAVDHAGLNASDLTGVRTAVCMGTTSGESQEMERITEQYVVSRPGTMCSDALGKLPADNLARAALEEVADGVGEHFTFSTACSASNYSIAYGGLLIDTGQADVVVVGGADSVCRWAHAGFFRLGAMSPDVCSPFDANRKGILTAEGGVALVLESAEYAAARGATILGRLLGAGINCDADHMVAPNRTSVATCIRLALDRAGVAPGEVDYISAHGTGTAANDSTEGAAIVDVFGDAPPPVSSIKSMLGHTMGAASGFGAVGCVLALQRQECPPTANYKNADPGIGLPNVVPNQAQRRTVRVAENHGFAFGGNNAIVILGAA